MQSLFSTSTPPIVLHNMEAVLRGALRPPPKQTLSQWADANAYLSAESAAEPGRWRTLPYQRGIMDAFTDPRVEQVVVMKSARVGWSKIINNVVGYHMHCDPCSIMVVQPTLDDAKGYSKEEIQPMLRDTPVLQGLVNEARAKDADNTVLQKKYPGGVLGIVGANSPRGFRRVSRRVVLFDEVDGYPASAGAEGDQIKLGIKRTETFWNRKIGIGSTPTVAHLSRVQRAFLLSDQRRFFVPCPHCGEKQYLKWGGKEHKYGIKWPEGEPEKAYYVCEHNGCIIEHTEKRWMVERGEWIATVPGAGRVAGFHIWAGYSYSPNATWAHLAQEFLDCKSDQEQLKTFVNTTLGEVWEEEYTAKIGAEGLAARAEPYDLLTIPMGGLVLTAGIDVQDNRIEFVIRAWGRNEESWLVNYGRIFGDPAQQDVWNQLDDVLGVQYRHASGVSMRVFAAMVDTGGHYTHETYAYCRARRKSRRPFILAIKGMHGKAAKSALGKPSWQDVNFKGQTIKKGIALWGLGVDTIKSTIYGRLKLTEAEGAAVYHFPMGLPEEYYKQLTAERAVTKYKNGFPTKVWVKKSGDRNEVFDCEVYGYAALLFLYTRYNRSTFWSQLEKELAKKQNTPQNTDQTEHTPPEPDPSPDDGGNKPRRQPKRGPMRRNRRRGGIGW